MPNLQMRTHYEVTTTKYKKDGSKQEVKTETLMSKPKAFKDLNNSLKMIEKIKQNSIIDIEDQEGTEQLLSNAHKRMNNSIDVSSAGLSKASGQGYLSAIMNPSNVASMSTINLDHRRSNIYINTLSGQKREGSSSKRQKIIIIKKKRHADGSVESVR